MMNSKFISYAIFAILMALFCSTLPSFSFATSSTHPTSTSFFDSLLHKDNQTERCQILIDAIMRGENFTQYIHADLFSINFNTNHDIPVGGSYLGQWGLKSFANKLHDSVILSNSTMHIDGVDEIAGMCSVRFTTHFQSKQTGKATFFEEPEPTPPSSSSTLSPAELLGNHPPHSHPVTVYLGFKSWGTKYIGVRISFPSMCEYKWASSRFMFDTQLHVRNLARAMYAFGYSAKKVLYYFFTPRTTVHISPPFLDLNIKIDEGRQSLVKFINFARKIRGCPIEKKKDHCPHRSHFESLTMPMTIINDINDDNNNLFNDLNDDSDDNFNNPMETLFQQITSLDSTYTCNDSVNNLLDIPSSITSELTHTLDHMNDKIGSLDDLDKLIDDPSSTSTHLPSDFDIESMLNILKPLSLSSSSSSSSSSTSSATTPSPSSSISTMLFGHHDHHHDKKDHRHHHKKHFNPHCLSFPIIFPYISLCHPEYATNSTAAYLCVPPVVSEASRPYLSHTTMAWLFSKGPLIRVVIKFEKDENHCHHNKIDSISYTALQAMGYVVGNWKGPKKHSHHDHITNLNTGNEPHAPPPTPTSPPPSLAPPDAPVSSDANDHDHSSRRYFSRPAYHENTEHRENDSLDNSNLDNNAPSTENSHHRDREGDAFLHRRRMDNYFNRLRERGN